MRSYVVGMRFYLHQQAQFLQIAHNRFARFITSHARILAAQLIDARIVIHHIDFRQAVPFSHFKIIGVMGRCNLYAACPELFIHIGICHHRNLPVCQRQLQHLAHQILISLILRVDCHGSISQQCLWTSGSNFYKPPFFPHDRIINVPEMPVLIHMLYLGVRN